MVENNIGIQLIGDRVLIYFDAPEDRTKGGILLPESARRPSKATVIALGTGRELSSKEIVPFPFQVGDEVLVNQVGEEIEVKGKKCRIVTTADVLAVQKK